MAEKWSFQIQSSLASQHLTDAQYIQGGYIVVKDTTSRDKLPVKTDEEDGVIIEGSLVYVSDDKKSYRYTNSAWVEESSNINIDDNTVKLNDDGELYVNNVNPVAWKTVEDKIDLINVLQGDSHYFYNKAVPENTYKIILKTKDEEYKLVIEDAQHIEQTLPCPNVTVCKGFTVSFSNEGPPGLGISYKLNGIDYEMFNFVVPDGSTGIVGVASTGQDEHFPYILEMQFYSKENKTITVDDEFNILEGKVKANPTQWATSTLSTVKIGDVVYDLDGGTGSTLYTSADAWTDVNNDNFTIGWSTSAKDTWHVLTAHNETWKDITAPPTATDNKQYVYKNNAWSALPELSDTVITATNSEGVAALQSVVSLTLGDDGLLKFNNGKIN